MVAAREQTIPTTGADGRELAKDCKMDLCDDSEVSRRRRNLSLIVMIAVITAPKNEFVVLFFSVRTLSSEAYCRGE